MSPSAADRMSTRETTTRFNRQLALLTTLVAATLTALATPFQYGEGVAPLRWPAGKVISVYVETDPVAAPPDTSELLAEGMRRWIPLLAARGITMTVTVGAPPVPPPRNLVLCTYEPVGTFHPDDTNHEGPSLDDQNDAIAGCGGAENIDRGSIIVRDDLWAASGLDDMGNPNGLTDAERETYIRNLGAHEITHILGLADDTAGSVTNHLQGSGGAADFNDRDRQELNTLYPLVGAAAPRAAGARAQGTDPNTHNYNFQYQGLPGDHVPLITLDIPAELMVQVTAPPGWVVLNPADPGIGNRNHPFYQGYMEDGRPDLAPYDADASPAVAIRAVGANPGLTANNPTINIVIRTHNARMGVIPVWAGGETQFLQGPVLPGLAGDMNCDGQVSVSDIGAFVLALTNPAGYAAAFPLCSIGNGDLNGDNQVSVSDIALFVSLLTGN